GLLVDLNDRPRSGPAQDLLKRLHQIDDIGGQLRLGTLSVLELFKSRVGPYSLFDLLFLQQHLRCRFELLMLEQAIYKFEAWVFLRAFRSIGISRQQHFGLDMDEQRSHVDEFGSDIYIQGMDPLDVSQVLGCDIGNRDVINVDFLLANEVQKQIQR